ncbi:MAG: tRNA (adenosine(37)-N6)-threonylcarbamoyltransferase complex dimerization subunit type 1 TsaB [Candidatus Omnitrophica bacterium]|nr:tRNA (adenosine(37)-N6)-threonylcarbamoyltransferase complex dimerization subunit type 1 TsaB [Candidatus Omnitrophota bacterium]
MKILAIDTSSKMLSIALGDGKDIIKEENYLLDRRHSSLLIPKIKEMLEGSSLSINKIDAFVVGLGPGSFTGLRIGVSAVKGLGLALKKPCIGIASIDALAMNTMGNFVSCPNGQLTKLPMVVPIIDAKRENVYSAIYEKKNGRIIRKTDYLLIKVDKLLKKVKKDAIFLGDGVSIYKDKIGRGIFLQEKYWYPKAGNLIKLALPKIKRTKKCDLARLEPIYLYPKDCQVKK